MIISAKESEEMLRKEAEADALLRKRIDALGFVVNDIAPPEGEFPMDTLREWYEELRKGME